MKRVEKKGRLMPDARVIVSISGLILSVILHELFHIVLHIGQISSIRVFPAAGTIMEITSVVSHGYNVELEEAIAYTITVVTMLATIMIVWKIHDKKDTRSYEQILFPV